MTLMEEFSCFGRVDLIGSFGLGFSRSFARTVHELGIRCWAERT